jgi:hypothetical protein
LQEVYGDAPFGRLHAVEVEELPYDMAWAVHHPIKDPNIIFEVVVDEKTWFLLLYFWKRMELAMTSMCSTQTSICKVWKWRSTTGRVLGK